MVIEHHLRGTSLKWQTVWRTNSLQYKRNQITLRSFSKFMNIPLEYKSFMTEAMTFYPFVRHPLILTVFSDNYYNTCSIIAATTIGTEKNVIFPAIFFSMQHVLMPMFFAGVATIVLYVPIRGQRISHFLSLFPTVTQAKDKCEGRYLFFPSEPSNLIDSER